MELVQPTDLKEARRPTIVDGRPTAEHPWKKRALLARGRAREET